MFFLFLFFTQGVYGASNIIDIIIYKVGEEEKQEYGFEYIATAYFIDDLVVEEKEKKE